MTERDREIVRQVHRFRLLTREQIERLLFAPAHGQTHPTKTSKASLRLKLLYQHGYLERIPTPVASGAWAWRPVYRLSAKGAALVAAELGLTPRHLAYWGRTDDHDHRPSAVSWLFLQHVLALNDVRIAITEAALAHGYRLETWLDDTTLKRQERRDSVLVTNSQGRSHRVPVIPDAYFALHLGDRRAHFLLELDRATMNHKRWKLRVQAYLAYVRSGQYQARYQTHSLRILTVTTTVQRLANLQETTRKAGGDDLFWFTTQEELTAQSVLSSPIWRLASAETDRSRNVLIS
ncbi:MAG: replication-relaxation family protein [Chloroflexi bacterium]|nr:replication-relaxation family protein [Chloroflexota bacterium]